MKFAPAFVITISAFFFAIALAQFNQSRALINPELHMSAAPEDLTIEILESLKDVKDSIENIWIRARVLKVHKSETGLKPGQEIEISYRRDLGHLEEIDKWFEEKSREPGWAGETPPYAPGAPDAGQKLRAYLKRAINGGQSYQPAANQYSFEPF